MAPGRGGLRQLRLFLAGPILFMLMACAAPLTELAQDYKASRPARIAVLPSMNETADMDAPLVFRIMARAELSNKGYNLIDSSAIDEALRTRGIEEAGQLESLTAQQLGELLGADALLYIRVMGYGRQAGVHLRLEGSFTLVDSKTARKLWYSELGVSDDILMEGGAYLLGSRLVRDLQQNKDPDYDKKAMEKYMALRQERIKKAVARFQGDPLRSEIFRVITLDMDKIPLLDVFFSKNFKSLPPAH